MPLFTLTIGYVATITGSFLMLPQVIRSWKTKRAADVSSGMVGMYFANSVLWLTYGFLIHDTPVALANAIALVIVSVQIGLKMRYGSE